MSFVTAVTRSEKPKQEVPSDLELVWASNGSSDDIAHAIKRASVCPTTPPNLMP